MIPAEQIVKLNDDLIKVRNQNFQLVKLVDKLTDALKESSATVVNGEKLLNLTERIAEVLQWANGRIPGLVSIKIETGVHRTGASEVIHRVYVETQHGRDHHFFPSMKAVEQFCGWLEGAYQP